MEQIYIGQILELDDPNMICIHLVDRPSLIISKKTFGSKFQFKDFIVCSIEEVRRHKYIIRRLYTFKEASIGEIIFENEEPYVEIQYQKDRIIRIPCKYFPNLYDGAKVRFRLENNSDGIKAIIYKVLGNRNDASIDIMDTAESYDIPTIFSKRALRQASLVKNPDFETIQTNRKDLVDSEIFTIDGKYSKDFDDAISLKEEDGHYILGVHIADVDYYVKENSPLDLEARKRGMTAYLLNYVYPMLPENISNGVCSLNEGVYRLTLTCQMKISRNGIIKDVSCFPTIIESKKRMTYEDANVVLDGTNVSGYTPFKDTLFEMKSLADKLYERRKESGSIEFDATEPIIELDRYGHVVDVKKRNRGKSEFLIGEFMLAANRSIATLLSNEGIVYPHRIHLSPDLTKLKEVEGKLESIGVSIKPIFKVEREMRSFILNTILEEYRRSLNYPVISNILIGCMRRAKYSVDDLGHFGLGFSKYTHFTSPIRRYPDLMIHRIIKKHYLENLPQTSDDVKKIDEDSKYVTIREGEINKCEEKIIRLKSREYLLAHLGEEVDAVVKDCSDKGLLIELKNCIEGFILAEELDAEYRKNSYSFTSFNSSTIYKIGTKMKVRLVKGKLPDKVSFEIVENSSGKTYSMKRQEKFY